MESALIIFYKNPIKGTVKTRLAKDLGDDTALEIYQQLSAITLRECQPLSEIVDIHIFYSDHIVEVDLWSGLHGGKHLQDENKDLGNRMKKAFESVFELGYSRAVIIGTDCPYLTREGLLSALNDFKEHEIVIGPARDGGFYLLGISDMKFLNFEGITWSTNEVYRKFLENISSGQPRIKELPMLEDIDDAPSYRRFLNSPKFLNSSNL